MYILVVDDDAMLCDLIVDNFEYAGYQMRTALNGAEALQILRQLEPLPCVIILDIMMPVMDGWEFRRQQLQDPHLARIPVIMISASSNFSAQIHQSGIDFLAKPFTTAALLAKAANYCTPEAT